MVSEVGLKGPPPPAIVIMAVPIGLQLGLGDGLGEALGLGDGEGLGLGDGETLGLGDGETLGLGDGEGLGLGPACVTVAPALRKITPTITTAHWIQCGCFARGICKESLDCAAWF